MRMPLEAKTEIVDGCSSRFSLCGAAGSVLPPAGCGGPPGASQGWPIYPASALECVFWSVLARAHRLNDQDHERLMLDVFGDYHKRCRDPSGRQKRATSASAVGPLHLKEICRRLAASPDSSARPLRLRPLSAASPASSTWPLRVRPVRP